MYGLAMSRLRSMERSVTSREMLIKRHGQCQGEAPPVLYHGARYVQEPSGGYKGRGGGPIGKRGASQRVGLELVKMKTHLVPGTGRGRAARRERAGPTMRPGRAEGAGARRPTGSQAGRPAGGGPNTSRLRVPRFGPVGSSARTRTCAPAITTDLMVAQGRSRRTCGFSFNPNASAADDQRRALGTFARTGRCRIRQVLTSGT
jgi:hypothetical protein